jgi:hypothetical protein
MAIQKELIVQKFRRPVREGTVTAARLEAANKFLGTRICVSAVVANAAQDFHGRPIGDLALRTAARL